MHKGNLTGKDSEIAYGSIPSYMLRQFKGQDHRINVVGPSETTNSGLIAISARFEAEQVYLSSATHSRQPIYLLHGKS